MAQQVSTGELLLRLLASLLVIGSLLGLLVVVARRRSGFGSPGGGLTARGGMAPRGSRAGRGGGLLRSGFGHLVGLGVTFARVGGGSPGESTADREPGRAADSTSIRRTRSVSSSPAEAFSPISVVTATKRATRGRFGGRRPPRALEVVDRQALSRTTSMAVVRVGRRAYLVGATEASLSLLADVSDELDPPALHGPVAVPAPVTPAVEVAGCDHDEAAQRAALEASLRQWTGAPAGRDGLHPSGMELVETVFQRFGLPG